MSSTSKMATTANTREERGNIELLASDEQGERDDRQNDEPGEDAIDVEALLCGGAHRTDEAEQNRSADRTEREGEIAVGKALQRDDRDEEIAGEGGDEGGHANDDHGADGPLRRAFRQQRGVGHALGNSASAPEEHACRYGQKRDEHRGDPGGKDEGDRRACEHDKPDGRADARHRE